MPWRVALWRGFLRGYPSVAAGRIHLAPLLSDVFSLVELPRAMQRCFAKDDVIKVQLQIG